MKISELRSTIEEFIVEVLSEVDTDKARGTAIMSKSAKPSDVKRLTDQGIDIEIREAEEALMEMASFYKVKDQAGFKSALAKYQKAKGDKFDKSALGKILSILGAKDEVDLKALSKETGKDIATYNNPQTRGSLEKEGGEFTDYLEAGKGEKAPKEKTEDKVQELLLKANVFKTKMIEYKS
jgi:hypothetical protein